MSAKRTQARRVLGEERTDRSDQPEQPEQGLDWESTPIRFAPAASCTEDRPWGVEIDPTDVVDGGFGYDPQEGGPEHDVVMTHSGVAAPVGTEQGVALTVWASGVVWPEQDGHAELADELRQYDWKPVSDS